MSRVKTARQRQEILDAYKASGVSVSKWCELNGMHRTTVYRWLRQDAKDNTAKTMKPKLTEPEAQTIEPTKIKWLPVTKKRGAGGTVSKGSEMNQAIAKPDMTADAEIRVQIGGFTVITPDGFKRETLESVCQTLISIC